MLKARLMGFGPFDGVPVRESRSAWYLSTTGWRACDASLSNMRCRGGWRGWSSSARAWLQRCSMRWCRQASHSTCWFRSLFTSSCRMLATASCRSRACWEGEGGTHGGSGMKSMGNRKLWLNHRWALELFLTSGWLSEVMEGSRSTMANTAPGWMTTVSEEEEPVREGLDRWTFKSVRALMGAGGPVVP